MLGVEVWHRDCKGVPTNHLHSQVTAHRKHLPNMQPEMPPNRYACISVGEIWGQTPGFDSCSPGRLVNPSPEPLVRGRSQHVVRLENTSGCFRPLNEKFSTTLILCYNSQFHQCAKAIQTLFNIQNGSSGYSGF